MKKSLVYTATGDAGATSLVGGARVKKNDIRIEAYGTVDELNANLALLVTAPSLNPQARATIMWVQNKLFNIGAYLATDNPNSDITQCRGLTASDTQRIEAEIDAVDAQLPPLSQFVLPGGTRLAALCNVARTVCRRCERHIVTLGDTTYVDPQILRFINRLSDYLFVLGRQANVDAQVEEIFWDKDC
ncbi:MAG: cob(I)yrinic acid a,c-diamide adenosyltransferase [Muribaculaceae bacterium]|nr:cob(I)yrinic acid a,c-diamide adenosyltransferase [Muribaculaceae bacterium]MDE6320867.1 cob(I)yrinic acid a,c-diamide adenosyltransferase [Muribaculaceae bacterium]